MSHFHVDDEFKNLINRIFESGLINRDFHLTNFDNRKLGLTKIVDKYLSGKAKISNNINFEESLKNLSNIDEKLSITIDD